MSPDDRTNLLEELPAKIVKKWITLLSQQDRAIVNTLLNYPEESVGRLLTPDYVDLRMWMTAQQAIDRIRRVGLDKETVFYLYVIDEKRTLKGVVSLKNCPRRSQDTCERPDVQKILWQACVKIRKKPRRLCKNMT